MKHEIHSQIVELLLNACGDKGKPERKALDETLRPRIRNLFNLKVESDMSDELKDCLVDQADYESQPLDAWARAAVSRGNFSQSAFQPLVQTAALLDKLVDSEPLACFKPTAFHVTPDNKLRVQRLLLPLLYYTNPRLNDYLCKQRNLMHPDLSQGKNVAPNRMIAYSFCFFLADVFLDIQGKSRVDLLDRLKKVRYRDEGCTMAPGLPVYIEEQLRLALMADAEVLSCADMLDNLLAICRFNPFLVTDKLDDDLRHQCWKYFKMARHKPGSNECEDVVFFTSLSNRIDVSLLAVADGVSTAHVGSGRKAAQCIRDCYEGAFKNELGVKAKSLAGGELDLEAWIAWGQAWLDRFFATCNDCIVNETNQAWQAGHSTSKLPQDMHPMSSTLTVCLLAADQALLYSVGDSPALLYSPLRNGTLLKLTVDDHCEMENSASIENDPDAEALNRIVGAAEYNVERSCFDRIAIQPHRCRFQLMDGDLLLLCSDGLINGMEAALPHEKHTRIARTLSAFNRRSQSVKDLTYELADLDTRQIDDTSIVLLNALKKEKTNHE